MFEKEVGIFKSKITIKTNSLLGALALSTRVSIKPSDELINECGTAYTDGVSIFIAEKFWEDSTDERKAFVLLHELMHIMLIHAVRFAQFDGKKDGKLYNNAADYLINLEAVNLLVKMGYKGDEPKNWLYDEKYENLSTEEIYLLLDAQESEVVGEAVGLGDGGLGDDEGDLKPSGDLSAAQVNAEFVKSMIKQHTVDGKLQGFSDAVNGSLKFMFEEAKKPWGTILSEYMHFKFSADMTYRKPNRRVSWCKKLILPTRNNDFKIDTVTMFFDVSCSVSEKDILEFMNEMNFIVSSLKPELTKVVTFNADINQEFNIKSPSDIPKSIEIGGGTDVQCCIDYLNKNEGKSNGTDVAIIMSDFYTNPFGSPENTDLICLVVNNPAFKSHGDSLIINY